MVALTYGSPKRLRRKRTGPDGKKAERNSRFYYCPVYSPATRTTKQVSTKCEKLAEARAWVERQRALQAEGRTEKDIERKAEAQSRTFETAYRSWLLAKQDRVSEKRFGVLTTRGERYWLSYFGKLILSEIEPEHVERYLKLRKKGAVKAPGGKMDGRVGKTVSNRTLNDDLADLRTMFKFCAARSRQWVSFNPTEDIEPLPNDTPKRHIRLSYEEEARLLEACTKSCKIEVEAKRNAGGAVQNRKRTAPVKFKQTYTPPKYLRLFVLIAFRTAFRRRTVMSLQWQHVNFNEQLWDIPGEFMKSGRNYQAPISADLIGELKAWRASHKKLPKASDRILGLNKDTNVTASFKKAATRAGLEGLRVHDLRRAALQRWREEGVSFDIAVALSDHADVGTALRSYRSVSIPEMRAAAEAAKERQAAIRAQEKKASNDP